MNAPSGIDTGPLLSPPKRRGIARILAFCVLAVILGAFWVSTSTPDIGRFVPGSLRAAGELVGIRNTPAPSPAQQRAPAAAPVRVGEASRRDLAVIRRTPGTVIANTMVQVTSQVAGTIESANFREGQFVKKGDLLFQVDPRPFEAALQQAQAQRDRDRARLVSVQADADRAVMMAQRGIVSEQQRDQLVAAANALRATIAADEAAINSAQLNVEYSQIRSRVNGKTGPILVQPGNLVQANSTAPLVTIAEIQPVKISFNLPQSDLPLILEREREKALIATVDVNGDSGQPLSTLVDFVSNTVSDKAGTVELRATFANNEFSFLPGQLVNVTVQLDTIPNALIVSHDAVNQGPTGTYVYVVERGTAQQVPVKVLFDDGTNVAIRGNVKPGDKVIIDGQLRVQPGGAVTPIGGSPPVPVAQQQPAPVPAPPKAETGNPPQPEQQVAAAKAKPVAANTAVKTDPEEQGTPVPPGFYVQAGAYLTESRARQVAVGLESLDVKIMEANVNGHEVFRLRIGPFATMPEAKSAFAQAQALGRSDLFIVKE